MKISKIENQQTFGIRCINSKSWKPELLKSFEKSKLVQEIDAKYPNASANYFFFKQNDLANDEDIWTTLLDLTLTPQKIWHYHLDSHSIDVPDKYLSEKINKLSLSDLESEIEQQAKNGTVSHKVKISIKKEKPVIEFIKKIFGKNN